MAFLVHIVGDYIEMLEGLVIASYNLAICRI